MFEFAVGDFSLICHLGPMPSAFSNFLKHAQLVEEFDVDSSEGENCLVAVKRGFQWPTLVVSQRCKLPGMFNPHVLLVPETGLLFLGVGERLLAYRLDGPTRQWEDSTDCGVWGWARHDNQVLLSAELELAAWDITGRKLWTTFVEPPWEYHVAEGVVHLDVMGKRSSFPTSSGPT